MTRNVIGTWSVHSREDQINGGVYRPGRVDKGQVWI